MSSQMKSRRLLIALEIGVGLMCSSATWSQSREASSNADLAFDSAVTRAVTLTSDPCYGQFFQLVLPSKGSSRHAVTVIWGTVVRTGEEGNFHVRADGGGIVFYSTAAPTHKRKILKIWPDKPLCQ
jgi:hypothetical protein